MGTEILFRDSLDIELLPEEKAAVPAGENSYTRLPPAKFVRCDADIWVPAPEMDDGTQKWPLWTEDFVGKNFLGKMLIPE